MANMQNMPIKHPEDENDFDIEGEYSTYIRDDEIHRSDIHRILEQMFDSITRVGGEVCKLRAEMDGLIDQNLTLVDSFRKLQAVISEKGTLDLDDFQLACDVFDESQAKNANTNFLKKATH